MSPPPCFRALQPPLDKYKKLLTGFPAVQKSSLHTFPFQKEDGQ